MAELTHLDESGNAHMVDVSEKHVTSRSATSPLEPSGMELTARIGLDG